MSPESILQQCAKEGVSITVDGGKLVAVGTQVMLDEWLPLLRSIKDELIAYLQPGRELLQLRTALFIDQGVSQPIASSLAHRLQKRDDDRDERRLCLECSALRGTADAPRCSKLAATRMKSPYLPIELPLILQRCKDFIPAAPVAATPAALASAGKPSVRCSTLSKL